MGLLQKSTQGRRRKRPDEWSLSDEREFVENLFNQRLNFYLLVFSVVITAIFVTTNKVERLIVIGIGIVVCLLLALAVYRACHKLIFLFKLLHRTKGHPIRLQGKLASRFPWPVSLPVNHLLGIWMPIVTILSLVGLLIWTAIQVGTECTRVPTCG